MTDVAHGAQPSPWKTFKGAAWLGWQIVRKYMEENPKVTLAQLMAEKNAQKILTESKYKPKKS